MKEGTKPAEDPAHRVNWRPGMKRACKKAFYWYDQTSHSTWQHLYDEICNRYGAVLGYCARPDRLEVYERIVMNVLVEASNKRSHE